jgi:3-hydroxyisobutyrate dehydrogenase
MMGTNLQYMGPNGSGQSMKLINNALVAYSMIGLSEAMKMGTELSLDPRRLADVIKTLPVTSPYMTMKVENFVCDDFPVMFSLANMSKDLTLAHALMEKEGTTLDMLDLAYHQYKEAKDHGL